MSAVFFSKISRIESGRLLLRRLGAQDAAALKELTDDPEVYRYLPAMLFEKKYSDPGEVIRRLYHERIEKSLILGIFRDGEFCGLAELYEYEEESREVNVGYRLLRRKWGQGIASEMLEQIVRYLLEETEIRAVGASTMIENKASARVLEKNGFVKIGSGVEEDWGFSELTKVDKWIRRAD